MRVHPSIVRSSVLISMIFVTRASFAQDPAAQPPPPAPPPAPAPAPAPAAVVVTTPAATKADDGVNDHDRFIGHFAIGYFGIADVPFPGGGANGGITFGAVKAPVLGVRYWMMPKVGIDVGLGFGTTSGSTEVANNAQTTTTDSPSSTAFVFHAGVPLALATGKHFTWEVVPEANIGFASGTIKAAQPNTPDTSLSGFRFDIGARAGAEIHFGFIGIPELALEGSVGLYLRREAAKSKTDPNSVSIGQTTIGTTVGADPWALFVNNISALYYF